MVADVSSGADTEDTFDLPEMPENPMFSAMEQDMRSALSMGTEVEEDAPTEDDEPEEDFSDEEPEPEGELDFEPDAAEQEETPKAGRTADEWGDFLFEKGPQALTSIPGALRADAVEKYAQRHTRQAVTDAALITQAQLKAQRDWIKWTLAVDSQYADDPDGMLEWLKSGSQEAQAYGQWKRYLEEEEPPEARAQAEQQNRIGAVMQKQIDRLKDYPELLQELNNRHGANPYRTDTDGLERLIADVDELWAQAAEQKVAKSQEPAKKKAQARVANAAVRREAPRPDASRGRTAATGDSTLLNNNDHSRRSELYAAGMAEAMKTKR